MGSEDDWRGLEGPRLAVIAPNGPYEIQKTPPKFFLMRPLLPGTRPLLAPPAYAPKAPAGRYP